MHKKKPFSFPVEVFNIQQESNTLSKARVRIFYKYENRNGSFINDAVADKLITTLPYTPVKGIYERSSDEDNFDYTDHGQKRTEGRIYGVVPSSADMDFAWEEHEDVDGIMRTYAVTNVLLYSALYEEANEVIGKGQSMELYGPSIKGEWVKKNGREVYEYSDASFLGLQVLGDKVEPCFEGSSFFSLQSEDSQQFYTLLMSILDKLNELTIGREQEMFNTENKLFEALNNGAENASNAALFENESSAICLNVENMSFFKVNFTKNEETGEYTLSEEREELFAAFLTQTEKELQDSLLGKVEDKTFTSVITEYDRMATSIADMQIEIDNKDAEISTFKTDKETFENTIQGLKDQLAELETYRASIETAEKEAVIAKYTEKLDKEVLDTYSAKLETFTVESLKKELAYVLVESDASIFSKEPEEGYTPRQETPTGLEALLANYSNK